jgi:hypothetical protein
MAGPDTPRETGWVRGWRGLGSRRLQAGLRLRGLFGIFGAMYELLHEDQVFVVIADNERLPKGAVTRRTVPSAPYEPGHSERQVNGSVAAGQESRWFATLAVSMTGDQSIFLSVEREGPVPAGAPLVEDMALVIPPGEADAVLTLLHGIVAQARRDGVLPRRPHS